MGAQKGARNESAREDKRRSEEDGQGSGTGGASSYPRRSSGFKETINVLGIQWRTNGPLSGPREKRVSLQRLGHFFSVLPTSTKVHRVNPRRGEHEKKGRVSIDRGTSDKCRHLDQGRANQ